jgi:hypothetical protein
MNNNNIKISIHSYTNILIDSVGFWRWCVTLINTGFLDFVHRPEFYNFYNLRTETDPVSEMLCFLVIEFWTMDKVQKPSINEYIGLCLR